MGKYILYTDGACNKKGNGGWACCVLDEGENLLKTFSGFLADTTNNQMELTSVIEGLRKFNKETAEVTVISDSAYVVNCFLQDWSKKWIANAWRNSQNDPVKNKELWVILLTLVKKFKHPIIWQHIDGHSGNKFNELCDEMAVKEYKNKEIVF
jgi:ribonuclease HI